MNIQATILRTIRTHGTPRSVDPRYRQITLVDLWLNLVDGQTHATVDQVQAAADGLCEPSRFCEAPLVRLEANTYAQRITMVGFDHASVRETDDQRFDVKIGDRVVSTHATKDQAADAAEIADHEHSMRHAVPCRPTVADFHDAGRNAAGELVCYPDR